MDIDFDLVGFRIREVRNLRKMTAEDLAEKVDLAPESLRHIEIGASNPSLKKLYTIADALNVSLDYLTGRVPSFQETILTDISEGKHLNDAQQKLLKEIIDGILPAIINNL